MTMATTRAQSKLDPLSHLAKVRTVIESLESNNKDGCLQSLGFVVDYITQVRCLLADQAVHLLSAKRNEPAQKTGAKSFSDAVQSKSIVQSAVKSASQDRSCSVFVKATGENRNKSASQLAKEIIGIVRPRDLGVRITKISAVGGGVVLRSEKEEDAKLIRQAVEQQMENVAASSERKLNPRVVITNIDRDIKDEDLLSDIIANNFSHISTDEAKKRVRLVHRRKQGELSSVVIELDADLRKRLIVDQKGWAFIDFAKLRCYDSLYFRHCWKCQSFKHTADKCSDAPVCSNCGKDHPTTQCAQRRKTCFKCLQSEHLHTHKFGSAECVTAAIARKAFARRIDYGGK